MGKSEPSEAKLWSFRHQLFAAIAANLSGGSSLGAVLGFPATALPDLRINQPNFHISPREEKWIAPIALVGAILACFFAGTLAEKLGRKRMVLLLLPCMVGSWLLIGFAQNILMIYAGRVLTGLIGGSLSVTIPVFVGDISDVKIRGALSTGFHLMITTGILYIFTIGAYTSWRVQAFICCAIPIFGFILMVFVPESPLHLLNKSTEEESKRSIRWLYPDLSLEEINCKFELLKQSVGESKKNTDSFSLNELFNLATIKPIVLGLALMLFQQGTGNDPIMFYTVDIFRSAGSDLDGNLATIIIGAIQVAATIVTASLVDRFGRKLLLVISETFMIVSLCGLGLYFYIKNQNSEGIIPLNAISWLPLASLILYIVAFSIGFGPIPWVLLGELLPPKAKGVGSGIITITRWILGFVIALFFQDLIGEIGEEGIYWLFAGVCLVGGLFVLIWVPETKGKSLEEIQHFFV